MTALFLILFEICFMFRYQYLGTISLSDIVILVGSFHIIPKLLADPKSRSVVIRLSVIYALILLTQFFSDFVNSSTHLAFAKGIALTLASYLHFIFLLFFFLKDIKNVAWVCLGIVLRYFILGDRATSFLDADLTYEAEELVRLKFIYVPLFTNLLLFLSVKLKTRLFFIGAAIIGVLFIIMGARSGGGTIVAASIVSLYLFGYRRKRNKYFGIHIALSLLMLYAGYCWYINKVLDGEITTGNSDQALIVENPYNPVNLLMVGRSEFFTGLVAYSEKPVFGWGAHAKDPGYRFRFMAEEMHLVKHDIFTKDTIPCHSVILSYGLWFGTLSLILMILLFGIVCKYSAYVLKNYTPYVFTLSLFFIDFIWEMLYNETGAFRFTIPVNMAYLVASYLLFKNLENQTQKEN